jgi:heme oxygenase
MGLKELTLHKHREAESTHFMQELIAGHLPAEVWTDFVYQKTLFYKTLEGLAGAYCECNQVPDLYRAFLLYLDFCELANNKVYCHRTVTVDYHNYLLRLSNQPDKIMAHVYVWHMGDLFGGQMIKKLTPGSNLSLDFVNKESLIQFIRVRCKDEMAQEAITAFDYAIKIMNELF